MKRLIVFLVALATLGLAPAALADDGDATVTIVHGVPGLDVDVYANGDVLVSDFAAGELFGPAELPPGDYDIAIRAAGDDPDADPAIAETVSVPADVNATVVAHLDAEGTPTLTTFVNDTSTIEAGNARLVVRHTAAFGQVDVLADGDALVSGLANPDEAALDVPAGTYPVAVTAAGDPDTEAFSGDVTLEEGTSYLVHAIGDPGEDTFELVIQTIEGLHTPPDSVDTGSAGLAADTRAAGSGLTVALIVVALGIGAATPVLLRRR